MMSMLHENYNVKLLFLDASEEFVVEKDNSDNLMEQDPSNIGKNL